MRSKRTAIIACLLFGLIFAACGEQGSETSNANGIAEETGKNSGDERKSDDLSREGENFADGLSGTSYLAVTFYAPDDNSLGMWTMCEDGIVVSCVCNHPPMDFNAEDYIGLGFGEAFMKFSDLAKANMPDDQEVVRMSFSFDDKSESDALWAELNQIHDRVLPDGQLDHFVEGVEGALNEIARYETWSEEVLVEREARREEEEARDRFRQLEETPALTESDIIERLEANVNQITLGSDVTLNLGTYPYHDLTLECEGHYVTVVGTWTADMVIIGDEEHRHGGIDIRNASGADLSGVTVDRNLFADEDWIGSGFQVITVRDTPKENVKLMTGIPTIEELMDFAPFEGTLRIRIDPNEVCLGYEGPQCTYEERQQQDTDVVKTILTQGDAYGLFDEWTYSENVIWTEVTVDIGNAVLPNQDYMNIKLMPGAYLKITGSLTVTGGRPDWTVSEYSQLDITGLTLIKKHPSPDMLKIRFDPSVGIDTSLLKAKAGSGEIKYSLGSESYDITIW
jgi:hypothetical protein